MPDIARHTAQITKMMDLSCALLITSPILKLATSCGNTTDKLKIPIYKPILLWSTFSLMIANGSDTNDAQPIPTSNKAAKNTIMLLPNSAIIAYPNAINSIEKVCVRVIPVFFAITLSTNTGSIAPTKSRTKNAQEFVLAIASSLSPDIFVEM